MLNDTITWLSGHKDAFSSIESVLTIIAIVIGGIWALRRLYYERPYAGALEVVINGSLFSSIADSNLVHLFIRVKNIGKAAIKIGNTPNNSHRSSIKVFAFSSSVKILVGDVNSPSATINTTLTEPAFSKKIIDQDFVEQFKPWFESRHFTILESGESETYSLNFALDKIVGVILVQVTIYETRTNKSLGRPYYWREHELIDCTPKR